MEAVLSVMVDDQVGPGEYGQTLVEAAGIYLHSDYCLPLRSPARALHLALQALALESGQGVLLSALSPRYYLQVIGELGLIPLYCDVTPGTCSVSAGTLEAALERRPEGAHCILLHHTLGYVPDTAAIHVLGIPVIEDRSRSFGPDSAADEAAGEAASLSLLGLEERDMLTGGGGALLYAHSRRNGAALRSMDVLPEDKLPDLNAALALVQFKEAARNLTRRQEIGGIYAQAAARTRHSTFVQDGEYNYYAFPLVLETGYKDVKAYARRKDIDVALAFEDTLIASVPPLECPEAYSISLRTALFPLYPRLSGAEVERVGRLIQTLP
jgi:dTDP-4-amino-4,6-dideoxygalactose transaminase